MLAPREVGAHAGGHVVRLPGSHRCHASRPFRRRRIRRYERRRCSNSPSAGITQFRFLRSAPYALSAFDRLPLSIQILVGQELRHERLEVMDAVLTLDGKAPAIVG